MIASMAAVIAIGVLAFPTLRDWYRSTIEKPPTVAFGTGPEAGAGGEEDPGAGLDGPGSGAAGAEGTEVTGVEGVDGGAGDLSATRRAVRESVLLAMRLGLQREEVKEGDRE